MSILFTMFGLVLWAVTFLFLPMGPLGLLLAMGSAFGAWVLTSYGSCRLLAEKFRPEGQLLSVLAWFIPPLAVGAYLLELEFCSGRHRDAFESLIAGASISLRLATPLTQLGVAVAALALPWSKTQLLPDDEENGPVITPEDLRVRHPRSSRDEALAKLESLRECQAINDQEFAKLAEKLRENDADDLSAS